MVYTHYFGWLVVCSEVAVVAWLNRAYLKKIILMSAVVFLAFVPWIVLIFKTSPAGEKFAQNIGWMQRPGPITFFQFVLNLIEPIYFRASSAEYASNYFVTAVLLGITVIGAILYFKIPSNDSHDDRTPHMLLTFFVVPIILALIASWTLPYSIWGIRHLIIVFVPAILLVAVIVNRAEKFRIYGLSAFICLALVAFGIQLSRGNAVYIWCGWESLASEVEAFHPPQGEPTRIYVFEDLAAYHVWFSLRYSMANFEVDKLEGINGIKEDKAYFLPRGFDRVKKVDMGELKGEKFWIAFRDTKWDILASPLSDLTAKGYNVTQQKVFEAGREKAYLVLIEKSN